MYSDAAVATSHLSINNQEVNPFLQRRNNKEIGKTGGKEKRKSQSWYFFQE